MYTAEYIRQIDAIILIIESIPQYCHLLVASVRWYQSLDSSFGQSGSRRLISSHHLSMQEIYSRVSGIFYISRFQTQVWQCQKSTVIHRGPPGIIPT